jgi:hypothetical protein
VGLSKTAQALRLAGVAPEKRRRAAPAACYRSGDRDLTVGGESHERSIRSGCSLPFTIPRLSRRPGSVR